MPSTYSKFENARILLEQAVNSVNEQNKVRANLDAFVTTARSITLVMQKELFGAMDARNILVDLAVYTYLYFQDFKIMRYSRFSTK